MRFLNKIVLINSADKSLKYAEINLDGNVHFIGTQGVGKSTLLRTILFFYTADVLKLGISREMKSYNDYYFPYQNSYIVYEVQTETGKFCLLSFKNRGRVAFRFINSGYDRKFFIDESGRAFESWDKIREALGNINSTRLISNYEEYRNILYGNQQGLPAEFKKYALFTSKQYQNIPRTIANVFLNAKLDAEFVKETIIHSLTENELSIDLETYAQSHLRDFESELEDIKKWTEGQVDMQADAIVSLNQAYQFLRQNQRDTARQLGASLERVKWQQPKVEANLKKVEEKQDRLKTKLKHLANDFEEEKSALHQELGGVQAKLKEIKDKRRVYEALEIEALVKRVEQRPTMLGEQQALTDEKNTLTAQYQDIQDRFQAQIRQWENHLGDFINRKQEEKNKLQEGYWQFKEALHDQFVPIYQEIETQGQEGIKSAKEEVSQIEHTQTIQEKEQVKIRHKRFFESEITQSKQELSKLEHKILTAEHDITQAKNSIKKWQESWSFEEMKVNAKADQTLQHQQTQQQSLTEAIAHIEEKLKRSQDSLYGWLNTHVPHWEQTIGKVIDEERVLFQDNLDPRLRQEDSPSFYGVDLNISALNKTVKTETDLQAEIADYRTNLETLQQTIRVTSQDLKATLERLKRKYQSKIKAEKERQQQSEYKLSQSRLRSEAVTVNLVDWQTKAKTKQRAALEAIEDKLRQLSEKKIAAKALVSKAEDSLYQKLKAKRQEEKDILANKELERKRMTQTLEAEIETKRQNVHEQIGAIKAQQKETLEQSGADTKRLEAIDLRLQTVKTELNYIENNRDKVAEYRQDKRELFDKEGEFKSRQTNLTSQEQTITATYERHKRQLTQELAAYQKEQQELTHQLTIIKEDLSAFDSFAKRELYLDLEPFITQFNADDHHTEVGCRILIDELNRADNTLTKRFIEMQEAVNLFSGHFQEGNLFQFPVNFIGKAKYFEFALMLKEFMEEDKISEYIRRVEERFAHIIRLIGREIQTFIEQEGEISKIIRDINQDFIRRNFVGVIKSMELKTEPSANPIFRLLVEIKEFSDENALEIGELDLFSTPDSKAKNAQAIELLKQLAHKISVGREKRITLSNSFELRFKIVENNNDTGWVEKLSHVGSEGTDILVKAMINIMLLNVLKDKAVKKGHQDFRLHCVMDEIGRLHPNNVKGILNFANERNILLINSSPTSLNAWDYRYTYLLTKDNHNVTTIKQLVKKISPLRKLT